jgi:hypothetical protein
MMLGVLAVGHWQWKATERGYALWPKGAHARLATPSPSESQEHRAS